MHIIKHTPCTLVTGFLGSGKTTRINRLLTHRPNDQTWAILVNEVGQIGVDERLLLQDNTGNEGNIAIRQVTGGCICCTSQLPLQIALSRLLAEHHPQWLLIEPTGLAHPKELLEQLSQPHWQSSLAMKAVLTVLNAKQWQQAKYREHDGYQLHIRHADVVVINRTNDLSGDKREQLSQWVASLNDQAALVWDDDQKGDWQNQSNIQSATPAKDNSQSLSFATLMTYMHQPSQVIERQAVVKVGLTDFKGRMRTVTFTANTDTDTSQADKADVQVPYRYHEPINDSWQVGGWRLPAEWQFDTQALQDWLLSLPNWQRIKAVVNTLQGWQRVNFTPDSLNISDCPAQTDNIIELIVATQTNNDVDWQQLDTALMALVLTKTP